jgi:hypothetical protein
MTDTAAVELQSASSSGPSYFPVSTTKLLVMSICTLGIYQPFWLFSQWYYVRENENRNLSLIFRVFFAPFFCYPLFRRIRATARRDNISPSFAAGPLALGWAVFFLASALPPPADLLSVLSVLFLLPVQRTVNAINQAADPEYDRNASFTPWNKAAVVIGGLVWLLVFLGFFIAHRSASGAVP